MTSSGLIPKGSLCSLQFLLVFRNPDFFEEPDSYLPSRWENPTREMKDAFNPFSLGKQVRFVPIYRYTSAYVVSTRWYAQSLSLYLLTLATTLRFTLNAYRTVLGSH